MNLICCTDEGTHSAAFGFGGSLLGVGWFLFAVDQQDACKDFL